jgi:hypothetical protein
MSMEHFKEEVLANHFLQSIVLNVNCLLCMLALYVNSWSWIGSGNCEQAREAQDQQLLPGIFMNDVAVEWMAINVLTVSLHVPARQCKMLPACNINFIPFVRIFRNINSRTY